ncbi:MAG: alpha/beta hydrolase [Acidobacteriota bacterium]
MPYLTALLLDRGNDWLVHWRLRGRHPRVDPAKLSAYLANPPEPLFPAPQQLPPFNPVPALSPRRRVCRKWGFQGDGSRGEPGGRWEAASPWPDARGANARWLATRVPPLAGVSGPAAVPAVLLLHGWLVSGAHLAIYRSMGRRLARSGIEVWIPRLPHHVERASLGAVSGESCLSADLVDTAESLRQGVAETRALAAWLYRRGAPAVGLWGTSLGGWIAALSATLDADWAAVALWAPVASPAQVLWETRLARDLRGRVTEAGMRPGDEETAFSGLVPGRRRLRTSRERLLLVGAFYDQVVSATTIADLARHWGVDVRWFPHGHISLIASPANLHLTSDFFRQHLARTSQRLTAVRAQGPR